MQVPGCHGQWLRAIAKKECRASVGTAWGPDFLTKARLAWALHLRIASAVFQLEYIEGEVTSIDQV